MYEYDRDNANESVLEANKANESLMNIPVNLSTIVSLAACVKVSDLGYLSDNSYIDDINIINDYDSIITGMINKAERDLIIECVQNGDMDRLVQYVNEGKISTQSLIEYGKEYMIDVMNNGNLNDYNKSFNIIGGDNKRYHSVNSALKDLGFNDEFIYNLSNEFCKNLIKMMLCTEKKEQLLWQFLP